MSLRCSSSRGRATMPSFPRFMITCLITAVALQFGSVDGWTQPGQDAAQRLVGMWQLVSVTTDGQMNPDRGPHPTGFIVYDKSGNMAVQIMPDRPRTKAGAQLTAEEAKAALVGYTAYFGSYTVDANAGTVTHRREGNIIPGSPIDVVRRFEFVHEDRVVLRPVENSNALTWERVR